MKICFDSSQNKNSYQLNIILNYAQLKILRIKQVH